jgi:hypothetical protein
MRFWAEEERESVASHGGVHGSDPLAFSISRNRKLFRYYFLEYGSIIPSRIA